jgi:hypothetical protein
MARPLQRHHRWRQRLYANGKGEFSARVLADGQLQFTVKLT